MDEETLSNALPLPPCSENAFHMSISGNLTLHQDMCQFHRQTSCVLGVSDSLWREVHSSLANAKFLSIAKPGGAAPRRSFLGGRSEARLSEMSIGPQCSLYMSRREPRLFGVLFPGEQMLLLLAPSPAEALGWVGVIGACISTQRAVAASNRIPLRPVPLDVAAAEAVMCSTGMSPAGISAQLDVLALEEDCSSFRRLGLPRALSGWQTREVQLAWYEMLVLPFNKLLNRGVHKGTLRGRTGKIRVKLAKEHVELYAVPSNPCLIALVHGPQRKLLLLRTPDPETAADWGMFLAGAIAVNWGHELTKHPSSAADGSAADGSAADAPPPAAARERSTAREADAGARRSLEDANEDEPQSRDPSAAAAPGPAAAAAAAAPATPHTHTPSRRDPSLPRRPFNERRLQELLRELQ